MGNKVGIYLDDGEDLSEKNIKSLDIKLRDRQSLETLEMLDEVGKGSFDQESVCQCFCA